MSILSPAAQQACESACASLDVEVEAIGVVEADGGVDHVVLKFLRIIFRRSTRLAGF